MSNGKICKECGSTPCNDECSAITITESQIEAVFYEWEKRCRNNPKKYEQPEVSDHGKRRTNYFLEIYKEIFTDDKIPT